MIGLASVQVVDVQPGDERWLAHLRAHPGVDFHQSPRWVSHLQQQGVTTRALMVLRDGEVVASMVVSRDETGWTCWRGPVGTPEEACLETLILALVESAALTLVVAVGWDAPADRLRGLLRDGEYTTHLLDVRRNDEDRLSRMTPTARNRARRAGRLGVTTRVDPDVVDRYFDLYRSEMQRVDSPDEATRAEMTDLCAHRGALLFTSWHEGDLVAGAVALDYDGTLEMRYVATDVESRRLSPMNLLYLDAMRWGAAHDRSWLDVSGIATGADLNDRTIAVNHFKSGFGVDIRRVSARYTTGIAPQGFATGAVS